LLRYVTTRWGVAELTGACLLTFTSVRALGLRKPQAQRSNREEYICVSLH
jgi:hypothetical protein